MRHRMRLFVYSVLALPLIAACVFLLSLDPLGREIFLGDFGRNVTRLFSGEWSFSELPKTNEGGRSANTWREGRYDVNPRVVFDQLDDNADGKLAGDELSKQMQTRVDQVDANQDGSLSMEEFQQAVRADSFPGPAIQTDATSRQHSRAPQSGVIDRYAVGTQHDRVLRADELFDPNHVIRIQVDISEDSWQALCNQSRDFREAVRNPLAKPYTYFRGDVTIEGRLIKQVGIRKKGFIGSQDTIRPSLKIKFDEFVDQQPVGRIDRLTLNNNKQDASLLSQCLTYQLFRKAGVAAPRCSYAAVTVNGKYLGIYSHVESVRKPFLHDSFGDDSGSLYEGTLTDFYPKSIEWFEPKANEKQDRPKIRRLAELLNSNEPTLDNIDQLVDVDNFLRYWAVESLINFWDGYTQNQNNFFVYDHPSDGKLYFVPWGADSCFGGRPGFARRSNNDSDAVRAISILANRLYHTDGLPERYRDILLEILADVWNEEELLAETDRIENLLFDHMTFRQVDSVLAMEELRGFIRRRRQKIMTELDERWPIEVSETPRKPMYTVEVAEVAGTFSTTWPAQDNEVDDGTGTAFMTFNQDHVAVDSVTARMNRSDSHNGGPVRAGPEVTASIVFRGVYREQPLTLTLALDDESLRSGLGTSQHAAGVFRGGGAGFSWNDREVRGELELTELGAEPGDTIAGEFAVKVLETRGGLMDRRRW